MKIISVKDNLLLPNEDSSKQLILEKSASETFEYAWLLQNKTLSSVFILDNVLLPLLRSNYRKGSNLQSSLHITYAKKFTSRVCHFSEQNKRGLRLNTPRNIDFSNIANLLDDNKTVQEIEKVCCEWNVVISKCIENELNIENTSKTPMGEVDFWRRRHIILSDMIQQVRKVDNQKSLDFLSLVGSPIYSKIQETINYLMNVGNQANKNAKFLSTLERHLRILNDGSFRTMTSALPSLVDGIRMVWTISRYYNRDQHMIPFMEKISYLLATRVNDGITEILYLFDNDLISSRKIVSDGKNVLETWKLTYMNVRSRINTESETGRRWEFDQKVLFGKTDYITKICSDIIEVLDTIVEFRHFQQFMASELSSISEEFESVNSLFHDIQELPTVIKNYSLSPFDREYTTEWKTVMSIFRSRVRNIEIAIGTFIERIFQRLVCSLRALNFVISFRIIKSRPSIHEFLEEKNDNILEKYEEELEIVTKELEIAKALPEDPPISILSNTPGSITWANDLYIRVNRPIVCFRQHGLLNHEKGVKVKKKYLKVASSIDGYKESVFMDWADRAHTNAHNVLRMPLLSHSSHNIPMRADQKSSFCRLKTNFPIDILKIIEEAKHFRQLNYEVPQSVIHLVLQDSMYNSYVMNINKMIDLHNSLESISELEHDILKEHITKMNRALNPGLTTLTWSSQRIQSFISKATNSIERLQSTVNEIREHTASINESINQMKKINLIDISDFQHEEPLRILDFVDTLEQKVKKNIDALLIDYKKISSLAIKIQIVVTDSSTGFSSILNNFYLHWIRRIYNALVEMTIRSLLTLNYILSTTHTNCPLCFINLSSEENKSVSESTSFELCRHISRCVRRIVDTSKIFCKWMKGSCIEVESQSKGGTSDTWKTYTFYEDVSRNVSVVSCFSRINHDVYIKTDRS